MKKSIKFFDEALAGYFFNVLLTLINWMSIHAGFVLSDIWCTVPVHGVEV